MFGTSSHNKPKPGKDEAVSQERGVPKSPELPAARVACFQNYIQPHRRGTTESSLSASSQSSCPDPIRKDRREGLSLSPAWNTTTYLSNHSEHPRNQRSESINAARLHVEKQPLFGR